MFRHPEQNRFYNTGGGGIVPPVETPPVPVPESIPPARRGGIECGFCECQVAPDGGILRTSDRARKLAKADDLIGDLRETIKALEKELSEVKKKFQTGGSQKTWPKFLG